MISITALAGALASCSGQRLANALAPTGGLSIQGGLAYGPLPRQKLDVYVPENATRNAPVIVFFYGGRWSEGARENYLFAAQALTSRGFTVVVPDYRLYPQVHFPAFVEDGAAAVAWVFENIKAHVPGNSPPIFLMGHSAGAHIAAMLSLDESFLKAHERKPRELAGMIGLAGPYDFLPLEAEDLKDMFGPPERYPQTQPINYVDGSNPPMLLLHGDEDESVLLKNSRNLAAAISGRGGSVRLRIYEGLGHIRIIGNLALPLRWSAPQLDDISSFVREYREHRPSVANGT